MDFRPYWVPNSQHGENEGESTAGRDKTKGRKYLQGQAVLALEYQRSSASILSKAFRKLPFGEQCTDDTSTPQEAASLHSVEGYCGEKTKTRPSNEAFETAGKAWLGPARSRKPLSSYCGQSCSTARALSKRLLGIISNKECASLPTS